MLLRLQTRRCEATEKAYSLLDSKDDILFKELQGGKGDIREYLKAVVDEGKLPNIDPVRRIEQRSTKGHHGTMLSEELIQENEMEDFLTTESHEYADKESDASLYLSPGDLVVLGASGFSNGQLALYVRAVGSQQQFYSVRGNWRIAQFGDAELICEKFVAPELLDDILPYFPDAQVEDGPLPQIAREGGVPRRLGASFIQSMRDFDAKAIGYHRQYHERLDILYESLAHKTDYRIITVDEILRDILKQDPKTAPDTLRYAIRKAIDKTPYFISANKTGPFTESFTIQPKERSDAINQVIEWVREYQGCRRKLFKGEIHSMPKDHPVATFVRKARCLVAISRELRQPGTSSSISPSQKKLSAEETAEEMTYLKKEAESFTENDLKIITYLRSYVLHPAQMTAGSLRAAASYIVRNTRLYPQFDHLSAATCYMFLQEIGVFKPWENQHLLTDNIQLPGHGLTPAIDKMVESTSELAETIDKANLADKMKDIRTDWGNLPVFCVDAVEAAEIDDGFSIESVHGSEDTYWIRVHVANPSAYIPHDSAIAERAQSLKRSFYTPERVYPMLPGRLTNKHFSLAPGRPTITFSAKVNKNGDILETDVRSGIINNVTYFTPNRLRSLLGVDRSAVPTMTLQVGDEFHERSRPGLIDEVPVEHHELLRTLFNLMCARSDRRTEKGGLNASNRYPANVSVYAGRNRIDLYSARTAIPVHYIGDPSIRSKAQVVDIFEKIDSVRDDLVSHVMLLAGEVAGKWCADRGIPAIYSATMYHPEYRKVTSGLLSKAAAEGLSSFGLPKGYTTSSPDRHDFLGMDQYLKTTSPLRRFADLLAHWQIESALLYEDRHGRPVRPSEAEAVVPFPRAAVDALISRGTWQNMQKDRAQRRSRSFWACQLLFRAFHHHEAEVPKKWQCLVKGEAKASTDPGERAYIGSMLPFDFPCVVRQSRKLAPAQAGDLIEVELENVDVYSLTISTRMTEMVKRPPLGPLAAMGFLL
ncbi:hypothetical protein KEM54_000650 [Ascosphaera aggregata]|nr:hypothetical protein KEM54_000650 [Ascosphaera aggregata]